MAVNLLGRAKADTPVIPATTGRRTPGDSTANRKAPNRKHVAWHRRPALLRAIAPLALLAAWQIASGTGLLSEEILPAPSVIVEAGVEVWRSGALGDALLVSGQRAALGFLLGAVLGVGLGVLAALSKFGEYAVDPPLQMLRTVPLFGLIPLFIIWFGIDEAPKVYLIALDAKRRPIRFDLFPTRLTDEGLQGLEGPNVAFWKELQPFYAQFEQSHRPAAFKVNPKTGAYQVR